jgi:hypothetical protein
MNIVRISLSDIKKINKRMEAPMKEDIDSADYLFDNFEKVCRIEFPCGGIQTRQPTLIKNLSEVFDSLAHLPSVLQPPLASPTHLKPKLARSLTKLTVEKGKLSKDKPSQQSKRSQLKIDLQNVFSTKIKKLRLKVQPESHRTKERPNKDGIFGYFASTNQIINSSFGKCAKKKNISAFSGFHSNLVVGGLTSNKSKTETVARNGSRNKEMMLSRIIEERIKKSQLCERGGNSVIAGVTRIHTASRMGSNPRMKAFFEKDTENKAKSISFNKRKTLSFLNANRPEFLQTNSSVVNLLAAMDSNKHLIPTQQGLHHFEDRMKTVAKKKPRPSSNNGLVKPFGKNNDKLAKCEEKYYLTSCLRGTAGNNWKSSSQVFSEDKAGRMSEKNAFLMSLVLPLTNQSKLQKPKRHKKYKGTDKGSIKSFKKYVDR